MTVVALLTIAIGVSDAQILRNGDGLGVQLPRKQTDGIIKKIIETQFMDAVTRIDEYIKFLFEVNSRLKTLRGQLACSDNITEIETVLEHFVKASQLDIRNYLESHEESLRKHPLKTLAESVADALSLTIPGHVQESFLKDAILDRLGLRFATLYNIAQENVAMLQSEIKTHLVEVAQQMTPVTTHLINKAFTQYHRLHSIILEIIHHPSS
ncbi:hypothetical protein RRG08_027785 [Elysia crispata]|uniref:Uncharacterized protein n=1 Tax=Elysia crispata TaxID=231223 RepID=A0AAE0ZAM4_9GAST|nr:hypothetical protein RRG08_027785 [Elysia crispata]